MLFTNQKANSLSQFLNTPILPSQKKQDAPKPNGRVLTSLDNRMSMEEKLKAKEKENQLRIKQRQDKKIANEKEREQKKFNKVPKSLN